MVNNTDVGSVYYNLTALASDEAINNTGSWLALLNQQLNGILIPAIIISVGVFLYITIREKTKNDTQSWSFAGIATTFISLLFFIIDTSPHDKLITWTFFLIIIALTATGLLFHTINRRY